jgi:hypothetical protein
MSNQSSGIVESGEDSSSLVCLCNAGFNRAGFPFLRFCPILICLALFMILKVAKITKYL